MKRYIKEIIILTIQLFMFYIFPLFAGPTDAMGMVVLILLSINFSLERACRNSCIAENSGF
mgnify:CR=1 FL=1